MNSSIRSIGRRIVTTVVVALLCGVPALLSPLSAFAEEADATDDPIEPFNRGIFWFNDNLDIYVLEPTARGWHWVMPDRVELCVSNFFSNIRFPIVTLNNVLQGKLVDASSDVGRFLVNTTIGVAGLFDPASDWGLVQHNEDFGQTLGVWGVPPGPYLVLPLLGSSNLRDGSGTVVDSFATVYPWFVPWYVTGPAQVVNVVNARAGVLKEVAQIREASFDLYSAARQAYGKRREMLIRDGVVAPQAEQDELYNVDTE